MRIRTLIGLAVVAVLPWSARADDRMPGWAYTQDLQPLRARTEQLTRLGATGWHAAGYRGKGVKVAVLDSGFRGYQDQLGKSLPEGVAVRSARKDGNLEAKDSQH